MRLGAPALVLVLLLAGCSEPVVEDPVEATVTSQAPASAAPRVLEESAAPA